MTHALSSALLHFVWQGLAVTIVLWLAVFALRKRNAQLRYAASCAALAVLVALPAITTWVLYVPRRMGFSPSGTSVPLALQTAASVSNLDYLSVIQSWVVPIWAHAES